MAIVFWALVIGSAVLVTSLVNRHNRKKYATLAAHMTASGMGDVTSKAENNLGAVIAQGEIPGAFGSDFPYV